MTKPKEQAKKKKPAKPKKPAKRAIGRPRVPDEQRKERADKICKMVADGKTLSEVGQELGGVSAGTVLGYITENPQFVEAYARAREAASDLFETAIIDAAMSVTNETAQADRVKIDALKWIAGRRSPRKYGERVAHELTGAGGGAINIRDARDMTDAELLAVAAGESAPAK